MKTIAISDNTIQASFRYYLASILDLLGVNYNLCDFNELTGDKYLDYVVVNSPVSKNIQLNAKYCLVNMDNEYDKRMSLYGSMITYGFGSKNTITISSVGDDNQGFVYCLQRYLKCNSSFALEPQEIPVHFQFDHEIELYAYMAAITIGLIEGRGNDLVQNKLNKKILTST